MIYNKDLININRNLYKNLKSGSRFLHLWSHLFRFLLVSRYGEVTRPSTSQQANVHRTNKSKGRSNQSQNNTLVEISCIFVFSCISQQKLLESNSKSAFLNSNENPIYTVHSTPRILPSWIEDLLIYNSFHLFHSYIAAKEKLGVLGR